MPATRACIDSGGYDGPVEGTFDGLNLVLDPLNDPSCEFQGVLQAGRISGTLVCGNPAVQPYRSETWGLLRCP